jgi:hypothetical protein
MYGVQSQGFYKFEFDCDEDLRNLLIGPSRHADSPLELSDWSLREPFVSNWRDKIRRRIRSVDQICVLCDEFAHIATGVNVELEIARDERIPYFLLRGRANRPYSFPTARLSTDRMYE